MEKNKDMNEMMNVGEKEVDEILLPGFRFHPTDEELVGFYLKRKIQQRPLSIELIKQLDIYKYDPWDLPKIACTGEKEWYFYCPRDRKYRNSARPNRVTRAGFWKATGTDRPIYSSEGGSGSKCIGLKKSLVFYKGRAAKGSKTDWMMHEFRLPSLSDSTISKKCVHTNHPANDSWAICRIFKKTSNITSRTLSHSWLSNPTSHSTLASSTNFSHEICSNVPEYDQILQSPYNSFSLLDHIPTFKPIYPSNYSAINKTCNDIPPSSYTLPQLEDPSEVSISISNDIDISSMLLTMSSSDEGNVEFGTLGNINEGYHEFGNVEDYHFLDRFGNNNNEQDNIPCTLFEDLDNRMFVEDDIDHTAGLIQVSEWLPLAMHEAWKSSTSSSSFMWDYAPPLS